jgi:PAS domain S-box-containing protein
MKINTSLQTPIRPDLLKTLVDHAEHGITIAEREGDDTILLYVNQAFVDMTGYSVDECLYKDCRFLQAADKKQDEIKKIHAAIQEEVAVDVLLRNYKKDGTLFWNDLSITPYFDPIDGVMYYIGIQKDVSDFIAVKEELAEAKLKLAELTK